MTEQGLAVREQPSQVLALPDEATFKRDIAAINRFQHVVHANMVEGHDYGVIPGTNKPTLLKPGAEKIAKLLGLADSYELVDRQEVWDTGFFRYLIRCRLTKFGTDMVVSEGLGECNSMESKYRYRWVWPNEIPEEERKGRVSRTTKNGGRQYRIDNEDIYSQVNTVLKMAKKRALVDASLSAGRLSDVFTQDIEEIPFLSSDEPVLEQVQQEESMICPLHKTAWFMKGAMRGYAHPIEGETGPRGGKVWCNMEETLAAQPSRNAQETPQDDLEGPPIPSAEEMVVYDPVRVLSDIKAEMDAAVTGSPPLTEAPAHVGELLNWCQQLEPKISRPELLKILNVATVDDIPDLRAAWATVLINRG